MADAGLGAGERRAGAGSGCRARTRGAGGRSPGRRRTSSGSSNWRGSRLAAPLSTITVVPAGRSTPPDRRRARGDSRKSPLTGLSNRSDLLDEVRDAVALVAEQLLELGALADEPERGPEEADRGLLAGGEEVGGDAHDVDDLRRRAVGERSPWPGRSARRRAARAGGPRCTSVNRCVEELQRLVGHRLGARCSRGAGPRLAGASQNSSWSSSGTPSRSAMTSRVKGLAYSLMNSHSPRRGTRRSAGRRAAT